MVWGILYGNCDEREIENIHTGLIFMTETILQFLLLLSFGLILFLLWKLRQQQQLVVRIHALEKKLEKNNDHIISLLRNYRHDWLNHMQVILGYVSLKKLDNISGYINHVHQEAVQHTLISKLQGKNLAVFLYMLPLQYPKIQVQLELSEELTYIDFQKEDWILETLQGFFDRLHDHSVDEHQIHSVILDMNRLENRFVVNIEYEGDFSPFYQQTLLQGQEIQRVGGEFFVDLYDDQCIIEFHFPIQARGVANVC